MKKTTHDESAPMTESGFLPSDLTAIPAIEPLPPLPEIMHERRRGPHFSFEVKCALKDMLVGACGGLSSLSIEQKTTLFETVDLAFEKYGRGHVHDDPSRWNVRDQDDGSVGVCFGLHARSEACEYVKFVPALDTVDAESYRVAQLGWQRSQLETDAGAALLEQARRFARAHAPMPDWLLQAIDAHLDDIGLPHPLHAHRVDCLAEADLTCWVAAAWTYGAQGAQMKGAL